MMPVDAPSILEKSIADWFVLGIWTVFLAIVALRCLLRTRFFPVLGS